MSIPLASRAMLIYNRKKGGDVVMTEPMKMNIFDSVDNNHEASEDLPVISKDASDQDMLDYMVLVLSRRLQRPKAFKGGYLLNQLLGNQSRMTHDVDFSIDDEKTYELVKTILTEIAEKFLEIGLIAEYKVKETIAPKQSGGIDFYGESGKKILGVDVGLHPLSWGVTAYKFDITTLDGFTVERMLSDKIIAILSRKRFRRPKDLYDLWVITNNFDFDPNLVLQFIKKRGNAEWDNIPFSDTILVEYKKAWDSLILQSLDETTLEKPSFNEEVLPRFNIIAFALKNGNCLDRWDHIQHNFVRLNNAY
jgi:hypothetical protein